MLKISDNSNYPDWVFSDLQKSGLTPENFQIELIKNEVELIERLGFSSIKDNSGNRIELSEHGGYWIPYPNFPGFYRTKLKRPIDTEDGQAKYLSPSKIKSLGNRPYIPLDIQKALWSENSTSLIFITEGEKKAAKATLENFPCIGLTGVYGWKDKRSTFLPELEAINWKGRRVFIVFDSDAADNPKVRQGEKALAIELINRGAEVFIIRLPGEPDGEKNGFDDYLVRYGAEKFHRLVERAKPAHKVHDIAGTDTEVTFGIEYPALLNAAAFHGLAGEIVRAIEPNSEADPVALLSSLLTGFGNIIGDGAYFKIGSDTHYFKIYAVLVGDSAKARKGMSWSPIRNLFEAVEPNWMENRVVTGLSSGEGVIYHLRDPIYKTELDKNTGATNEVLADAGETDKRLLVLEGELAQPLKLLRREGNILSPVLRNAWDSGDLRTLTKNNPLKASGAHLSIIGHITKQELVRALSDIETGNGFANRFLWFCVKRSKVLPFGGDFDPEVFEPLEKKLLDAVKFARQARQVTWAAATRPLWESVYPELSEGKPGLIGAITARAEAQVTRLACIYALLDRSLEIEPEHLLAALALWEYCEASTRYIFQKSAGDPLANKILKILASCPNGIGRREISNKLGRNYAADRISEALELLKALGYADSKVVNTGGRPAEMCFLIKDVNEFNVLNEQSRAVL